MNDTSNTLLGGFTVVLALLAAALIVVAAHPATTFNPTKASVLGAGSNRIVSAYQLLLPEGFAFFTRDPREPDIQRFQRSGGTWESVALGPHSRPSNLFGLNRHSRTQGVEYALLLKEYPLDRWSECDVDPKTCLDRVAVTDSIANPDPRPTLCGTVGFVRQEPVPWAWSASLDSIEMASQILKLHVSCSA